MRVCTFGRRSERDERKGTFAFPERKISFRNFPKETYLPNSSRQATTATCSPSPRTRKSPAQISHDSLSKQPGPHSPTKGRVSLSLSLGKGETRHTRATENAQRDREIHVSHRTFDSDSACAQSPLTLLQRRKKVVILSARVSVLRSVY